MERVEKIEEMIRKQKKPEPDIRKMEHCKERMEDELRYHSILPVRSIPVRMVETAGYCSMWTWVSVCVFCALEVILIFTIPYEHALMGISFFMPLMGVFLLPELARSFSGGMWEMEQSCYYNLGEILALKMVILGVISGMLMTFLAVVTRMESGTFLDFEIWIVLPFMTVSSLSFFLLRKVRSRQAEYGMIGVDLMVICAVGVMWNFKEEIYKGMETGQAGIARMIILIFLSAALVNNGRKFLQMADNGSLLWEEMTN